MELLDELTFVAMARLQALKKIIENLIFTL